jgi:UDP-N-acetylmuramate: L-alanyl-gamma-D-glutamyl-meso-diaminopimelate ligase
MKIHLIAIGGSIMHNLAISLQKAGHIVSGSDDEIYEPAKSQLGSFGLLPPNMGWDPTVVTNQLDLVILGMHAKADNPELKRAQELGVRVVSFPEYVGEHSRSKKRVVVSGSHGKTTTTSMILHVLRSLNIDFDYLVGARIEGFETMVQLSDAPVIVIEGDEYLSSSIDRIPKIWHYDPHITIITGVAWDHMNVFPTLKSYHEAFTGYLDRLKAGTKVYFTASDAFLKSALEAYPLLKAVPYDPFGHKIEDGVTKIVVGGKEVDLQIFGNHNMSNLMAAYLVLQDLGVTDREFYNAISKFKGAAKRLQLKKATKDHLIYQDFAHAPSKVKATIEAVKAQYPERKLTACIELHTFSSLSKAFLPQYSGATQAADCAVIFFSDHTLRMKNLPSLSADDIEAGFARSDLVICHSKEALLTYLKEQDWSDHNLLLMSSGTFEGLDIESIELQ